MAIYKNGNNKEQFSTENTQGYHIRNVDFLKLIKAIQKKGQYILSTWGQR